jgi:protein PhnA
MSDVLKCPRCGSEFAYEDGHLLMCPECAHAWPKNAPTGSDDARVVSDSNGNALADGDMVTVIKDLKVKDLKVKGSSSVVKMGTKVRNIRLVEGDHDIDCKVDGMGAMQLKSAFVKQV